VDGFQARSVAKSIILNRKIKTIESLAFITVNIIMSFRKLRDALHSLPFDQFGSYDSDLTVSPSYRRPFEDSVVCPMSCQRAKQPNLTVDLNFPVNQLFLGQRWNAVTSPENGISAMPRFWDRKCGSEKLRYSDHFIYGIYRVFTSPQPAILFECFI
jgi:hypothetical protein